MEDKTIYILFIFTILLHNIEEALWLPSWSNQVLKKHKSISNYEFLFAVIMVTVLSVLVTSSFVIFPHINIFKYTYFGFLMAMIINVFVPHVVATIIFRKYAPGLITGLLLILPINGYIVFRALNRGTINLSELIISTIVVGGILLMCLPLLFKLSKLVKDYS